jgi:hypothetical protein
MRALYSSPPAAGRGEALAQLLLIVINVAFVFFVTQYLFLQNNRGLFGLGWDQQAHQAMYGMFHRFGGVMVGVGMDPLSGLGNIATPFNTWLFPSYLVAAGRAGFVEDWPLSYATAATMLFATTAICGRIHGLSTGVCVAGAWLLTMLTWPVYTPPKVIALWLYTPQPAEIVSACVLTASAALRLGQAGLRSALWLSVAVFAGISYIVIARPTFLVLVVPTVAMAAATGLIFAPGRRGKLHVVGCWTGILLLCLVCGYFHYAAGLFSYTAAGVFPDLGKRIPGLWGGEASMLFWSRFDSLRTFFEEPCRVLIAGGIAGALAMSILGTRRQRILGACVLSTELIFIGIGISNYKFNFWFGPVIWYFECFLLPFHALCFAYLLVVPASLAWRAGLLWKHGRSGMSEDRIGKIPFSSRAAAAIAIALPILLALHAVNIGKRMKLASDTYVGYDFGSALPQPESRITRLLKQEATLVAGKPFRGRVATMLGRVLPEERYWGRYALTHYIFQFGTGNLHEGPGLWQDGIPTVFEYNPLMTPAYLAFIRTFLTEPEEVVLRNLIGTRRMNARILRMLGAKFVITDLPLQDLQLREKLDVPVSAPVKKRLELEKYSFDQVTLYLYELSGVNLGQFSPVRVLAAKDANQALTLLSDPALDPADTVVVMESVPASLRRATLQHFSIDRDSYRVRASSEGTALLLLPVEFSRCLRVDVSRGEGEPRLLRANLLLTGILFEKHLDAEIRFRSGPFGASRCRLQDRSDAADMQMRDAFRDRPEFGKLGWRDYWKK